MSKLSITQSAFGEYASKPVFKYTHENIEGMKVAILSYGGIIQKLEYPDASGERHDMVLGLDTLEEYAY